MKNETLVLLSGGMDSVMAMLAARRVRPVRAIRVNYGQKHFVELAAAWDIAKAAGVKLESLEFSDFSLIAPSHLTGGTLAPSVVVPGRNAFLLAVAGAYAQATGIDSITIGCNGDDAAGFPDCRGLFLAPMAAALTAAAERHVRIEAPWLKLSKGEAFASVQWTDEEMAMIRRSVSCYAGKIPGCGECAACEKRIAAFAFAGISEAA